MSTGVERTKILQAVDAQKTETACFLQRLIQFDSETGKEGPIQAFIAESLGKMGLEVDQWVPDLAELAHHPAYIPAEGRDFTGRPNVVGIHRGDPAARSLLRFDDRKYVNSQDAGYRWRLGRCHRLPGQ